MASVRRVYECRSSCDIRRRDNRAWERSPQIFNSSTFWEVVLSFKMPTCSSKSCWTCFAVTTNSLTVFLNWTFMMLWRVFISSVWSSRIFEGTLWFSHQSTTWRIWIYSFETMMMVGVRRTLCHWTWLNK